MSRTNYPKYEFRETPAKLSLEGKMVRLKANEAEGWPEETMKVCDDYELRKPDGFQRFIAGDTKTGLVEVTYDQVKEIVGG